MKLNLTKIATTKKENNIMLIFHDGNIWYPEASMLKRLYYLTIEKQKLETAKNVFEDKIAIAQKEV